MLGKLLKNDLKRNMKLLCILFLSTIVVSALTRGATELGKTIAFFKIVSIFFDSVFYGLLVNVIVHPFLRGFLNFNKSLYGDESYLTHTLPVTKNDIINSKFITAIIEMVCAFLCVVASLLIKFASPSMISTLKLLLSTIISGNVSVTLTIILFVALVIIEFLMFISIIYFSIIVANKSKEKRVLKTFLITALISFLSLMVLSIILVIVLLIAGVNLSASKLILSKSAFFAVFITGIVCYMFIAILFYFLAKKEFNKGVNVD